MSGNSDIYMDRAERRRLRRERRDARRGQCDSFAHAIRGPLTLVTVGVLFVLNNFTPYGFDKTWPVILIVFGFLTLIGRSTAPLVEPPPAAPPSAYAPPPPYTPPPSPGYRQSSYAQPAAGSAPDAAPPAGTAKGGFGTSAPPRQSEPSEPPPSGGSV